jgi:GalNAc-alpha-(1->4)-GalNAc-alpha-(1->3)-diNAcBac-PP-undecaprenol alpha-1,4-N-acetyl-D-galactosaminyltransferase
MRLTLVISTLSSGGAEYVLTTLANAWVQKGWEVSMLTLCGPQETPFFALDERIRRIPLDIMAESPSFLTGLANNLRRIWTLRLAIHKTNPELVISFLGTTNILALLAMRGLHVRTIVSERNDPHGDKIGAAWETLRKWTYPLADALVVQYSEAGQYFKKVARGRIHVIPNPVLLPEPGGEIAAGADKQPFILGMGRFVRQKGFEDLIRAFAQIKEHFPDWNLVILGDGSLREEFDILIAELGLTCRVFLPGTVKNPEATLARSSLFVLPSIYEGFPNALCEAMASGLAVLASDCPGGVREIVQDGVNGVLFPVGDVEALKKAMTRLMCNPQECQRLGTAARTITEQFSLDKVLGMWEALIQELIANKQP